MNVMVGGLDEAAVAKAVELAAAYRDAGADIAVMNLPHGAPPVILDRLAVGLSEL